MLAASATDSDLYKWATVPRSASAVANYIDTALKQRDEGKALAYATLRAEDGVVIGSTRFWNMESWSWPAGHARHGRSLPDVCEIGYTWLAPSATRTGTNTEAKLLMLTQAFEVWGMLCVCFHADVRNERSRAALLRIGAQFEGILRSHRMSVDNIARDSAHYSIVAADWPEVKRRLQARLQRG